MRHGFTTSHNSGPAESACSGDAEPQDGASPEAEPTQEEAAQKHRAQRCAYCVPSDGKQHVESERGLRRAAHHDDDECLIKMLGAWERRQVSLTLYRLGVEEGTFGCRCPMSSTRNFARCPFYEDVEAIDEGL